MQQSVWRWMSGILAAGMVLLVGRVGFGQQDMPCDQLIVDKAGVLGNTAEIETAAQSLVRIGATVRVRAIPTYGSSGSLDHYEAALEKACPSWQTPDGGTRNSLIVLVMAVQDRETGLYSGDQWRHVVRSNWDNIQSRYMNPRFRDGDFAGGFAAGLKELARLVEQSELTAGGGNVTVVQSDYSGCANLGWFAAIAVALMLILVGLVMMYKSRERRRAAQQAARGKKQAAATRITDITGRLPVLGAKVEAAAKLLGDEDAAALRDAFAETDEIFGRASSAYNDLGGSASNPDRGGRSLEEYREAERGYKNVLATLDGIETRIGSHERTVVETNRDAAEAPKKIDEAEAAMAAAGEAFVAAARDGWKTGQAEELFGKSRLVLVMARVALGDKKAGKAYAFAGDAVTGAKKAKEILESLPSQKTELNRAADDLAGHIREIGEAIAEGRTTFERVSAKYAEPSWQSVAGNGSKAERLVAQMDTALASARVAASMEEQRWDDAEKLLTEGNKAADRAHQLIHAIALLELNLKNAEAQAPREIEAAQADIERAQTYEHQHDADIDDTMKEEIRKAEATLAQAREEFAKPQPDYFTVIEYARAANEHADNILATSRTQHEAAERLRAKAESAIVTARTAVSRAKNYIKSHADDVGGDARDELKHAERDLAAAETATSAQKRLAHAEEAMATAKSAYKQAQADVSAAEEEEDDGGDLVGGLALGIAFGALGSSHRPSGGGGGGGISLGGGGGGGRSGGSSSWGGGGGRSGGSSKW